MEKEKLKFAFYWAASCGGWEKVASANLSSKLLKQTLRETTNESSV